ncbi:MAG: hypothetical protein HYY18_04985 [Planctomycetes bacterium]|nr:hypothetical protein [Planctomycetota bacterium]
MRATSVALFLALAAGSAAAQGQAARLDQKDIDAAIDRGANWLAKNYGNGWAAGNQQMELVMYTLYHSATFPRDHKLFLDGVERLKTQKLEKTYNVALTAMFLEAYDRVANQKRIAECAQFLVDNQCENGQWSYGEPFPGLEAPPDVNSGGSGARAGGGGTGAMKRVPIKRNRRGPPTGDHSNTQYAILGLRSCAAAEVIIPKETWKEAHDILEEAQDDKGGFSYSYAYKAKSGEEAKKGGQKTTNTKFGPYGSMTAGCTGSLIICKYYLKTHYGEKQDFRKDKSIKDGIEWIAEHFTVEENPEYEKNKATASVRTGDKYTWHYYFLYALERVGMLGEYPAFGRHDWYDVGARWLLAKQEAAGSWRAIGAQGMGGPDAVTDTCFAILFLRRATKPVTGKTMSGK